MDRKSVFGIFDAARKIDEATSPQAILDVLSLCLEPYGFRALLITGLPFQYEKRWHDHIVANGWPRDWYDHYNARNHYRHDPCVERSRATAQPFLWSQLSPERMLPAARLVMNEAATFGLREGICIPVHAPLAPPAVITVSGEFLDLPETTLYVTHALALHAFWATLRLRGHGKDAGAPVLSEREREILRWTGAGKTAWEISRILGLSAHTVQTHMRNAREKLGAANITHCVVEALRRQEVQL